MHWLSLFLTEIVIEDFPTSFNFLRHSCQQTMLTILIKAHCVNVMIDTKSIYLNKCHFTSGKIYYSDKICFCFAKIKLFKHTIKKVALAQVISKNTFFTEHLLATAFKQVYHLLADSKIAN